MIPSIWTDESRFWVGIELEPFSPKSRWVSLSGRCFAAVNGEYLAGFVAHMRARVK